MLLCWQIVSNYKSFSVKESIAFKNQDNAKEQLLKIEVFMPVIVVVIAISIDWETLKNCGNKFSRN